MTFAKHPEFSSLEELSDHSRAFRLLERLLHNAEPTSKHRLIYSLALGYDTATGQEEYSADVLALARIMTAREK